jgi:hydrophobe/amphiphile efflux-1 (HAE1) family protein
MNISHFFIDRPIFATVMSIIMMIIGAVAYTTLPIEQYPEVAPPTITVAATYPGANAQTVSETVATPIEQEVNGVEGMIYMLSQSTADGNMSLTVTFELGTDLDQAQVFVQNRVAVAEARLPEPVRRLGVTTAKNSPSIMMVINLISPNGTFDPQYLGNYAALKIRDQIRRIDGVGSLRIFGASEYAMRIWLDPDLIQSFDMSAGDVLAALRSQNVQVAGGILNASPQPNQNYFEYSIQLQGRLAKAEEFEEIIVKSGEDGRIVKLKDIARVELGEQAYITRGYLGENPAVALPIFQRPGTNALTTADEIMETIEALSKDFPPDMEYRIEYNPTEYIRQSVAEVRTTIYQTIALVLVVIIVFLQTWRAAIIPIVAIPVSLIGTFAFMAGLGFSLNNLSLFGLVLAVGVVVDDAIVVVENMERNMQKGLKAKDAARQTMKEVGGALIATTLVLVAVFLPTTFLDGISGQFYKQFGATIAVATVISTIVSLTLSPALAAIFMRPSDNNADTTPKVWYKNPIKFFFCKFNHGLEKLSNRYSWLVGKMIRMIVIMLVIYAGLMAFAGFGFKTVPTGFIPPQDRGYFIVSIQLPPGAALEETDAVVQEAVQKITSIDGVQNAVAFAGFAGATFTNATNAAAIFPVLDTFEDREKLGVTYDSILGQMRGAMGSIKEAFVVVIPPPPVDGIGNAGGFRMMIQDRDGRGLDVLTKAVQDLSGAANGADATTSVFSFFENGTPQLFLDIDREKAERLNVPVSRVFEGLEVYIGSAFVNDFNYLGRTYRVTAQADAPYRMTADDAMRIRVRSDNGAMVPIGSIATIRDITGPSRVPRYNLYTAAGISGDSAAGFSTGEALANMERLADEVLPDGIGYEWTDLAYQQKNTGNTAAIAFMLAIVFVFLLLAAQYESWTLPLAIVLIVPMCLLSAISGLWIAGMDNNILTQIGFVVLIGLACKNAILIVEFARELEDDGRDKWDAAVEACKLRLRPILMTAFSFILGVVPLVIASGAGSEMRQALGVTVFSGMIGVTFFGLLFTPVFYVLCRSFGDFVSSKIHGNDKDKEKDVPS